MFGARRQLLTIFLGQAIGAGMREQQEAGLMTSIAIGTLAP
jgi:hypothetical protein